MARELPYLASYKNVGKLFQKIDSAKKPDTLTTRVLADTFGLKSTSDRQLIALLKNLCFLDQSGKPTSQYDLLKNSEQAPYAIADGVRKAYAPLFEANERANTLSGESLRGLIAQVAGTDKGMASKIAGTFNSLVKLADFNASSQSDEGTEDSDDRDHEEQRQETGEKRQGGNLRPEFHYNIQIHLPANGSEETYLNIFNAIRKTFK